MPLEKVAQTLVLSMVFSIGCSGATTEQIAQEQFRGFADKCKKKLQDAYPAFARLNVWRDRHEFDLTYDIERTNSLTEPYEAILTMKRTNVEDADGIPKTWRYVYRYRDGAWNFSECHTGNRVRNRDEMEKTLDDSISFNKKIKQEDGEEISADELNDWNTWLSFHRLMLKGTGHEDKERKKVMTPKV